MRSTLKRFRRATIAVVAAAAGVGGGLAALAGTSSADVSGTTVALTATAPTVLDGVATQAASGWAVTMPNTDAVGDQIQIVVNPHGVTAATLDCTLQEGITFATVPTIAVTPVGATGGTAPTFNAPTISNEPGTEAACAAVNNVLTLTVKTIGASPVGSTSWLITIAGVKYTVGLGTQLGAVNTSESSIGTTVTPDAAALAVPANAVVSGVVITANSPAVALVTPTVSDQSISPITFSEPVAGQLPLGFVCVTLNSGTFNVTSGAPVIAASGGGATVGTSVTQPTANTLAFQVTKKSVTTAAVFSLSDLHVNAVDVGPNGFVASSENSATCTGGAALDTTGLRAFSLLNQTRTAGADSDATAAAEMESVFPPPTCPTSRTVVLATDSNFPDALSASYLAGQLGTGILLTPTGQLSTETANAIRIEGITNVDVVGGLLAVGANVLNTLASTPAFNCGGADPISPTTPLVVQQIAGTTQYDTSSKIAQYFAIGAVGTAAFPGAYGNFNDTSGLASASGPTTPVPTAIVATGESFADATASSVIGDAEHFPVVLTNPSFMAANTQATLTNLQIKQVILVGGPLAVSNAVVSQMQALGISVLRVAGADYTDTAQELAAFELDSASSGAGPVGLGWDLHNGDQVTLARGDFYSDGLAGAPFAARAAGTANPQPILLTFDPNTLGTFLSAFLTQGGGDNGFIFDNSGSQINTVNVLGGLQAVTATTVTNALTDIATG
ncbi:MAG TPA: cell wall-binding repeat-containing protein [Acidimicrobiales bacterium]|nr:cell wall-binding repeat-containing protein [Acidimicrobiales bacterium]